jgi:hypothetical protein
MGATFMATLARSLEAGEAGEGGEGDDAIEDLEAAFPATAERMRRVLAAGA